MGSNVAHCPPPGCSPKPTFLGVASGHLCDLPGARVPSPPAFPRAVCCRDSPWRFPPRGGPQLPPECGANGTCSGRCPPTPPHRVLPPLLRVPGAPRLCRSGTFSSAVARSEDDGEACVNRGRTAAGTAAGTEPGPHCSAGPSAAVQVTCTLVTAGFTLGVSDTGSTAHNDIACPALVGVWPCDLCTTALLGRD